LLSSKQSDRPYSREYNRAVDRRNLTAGAGAVILLVAFLAWEWYLSPEARVVRVLEGAAAAAEQKDIEQLLGFLSPDYSGYRNLDYAALAERLREGFDRVDRLNVTVEGIHADVKDDEATASFDLTVVAIRGDQRYILVGTVTEPERLRAHLRRENGAWKIYQVEPSGEETRLDAPLEAKSPAIATSEMERS
jgi:SnoaL-like domain